MQFLLIQLMRKVAALIIFNIVEDPAVVIDSHEAFLAKQNGEVQNKSVLCTRKRSYQNNTCEVTAEVL